MSVNVYIDIVFDGPPGPESGRFVEVENQRGSGIKVGEWINRKNGMWALRIPDPRRIGPLESRLTDMDNAMQAQIDATGRLKDRLAQLETAARIALGNQQSAHSASCGWLAWERRQCDCWQGNLRAALEDNDE